MKIVDDIKTFASDLETTVTRIEDWAGVAEKSATPDLVYRNLDTEIRGAINKLEALKDLAYLYHMETVVGKF